MHPASLAGREAHLGVLSGAINDARNGRSRTVMLWGEAGSGKTALLDAVAAEHAATLRVIRIAGHPAEQDLPFAGVHQLLRTAGLDNAVTTAQEADLLHDAAQLLEALTTLARREPVLLVIDDLQWLDRASHRALVFVARRLDADAMCMLFGVRTPYEDDLVIGRRLEVGPLSAEESVELLRCAYPDLSTLVATRLAGHAHGLPLALREIPAGLSAQQRSGTEPLPRDLPLGRSLGRLFAHRLAALPDATRLALLAASFDTMRADTYRTVLGELDCRLADLDAAERAGLVRVRDGLCQFQHPLVAAAVRAEARSQQLAWVHRVLAGHCTDDPVRRASHLRQDPDVDPGTLLPALRRGAEVASGAHSHHEAAELWRAAADLEQDPDERRSLLREAVRCLAMAGAGAEARAMIETHLAPTTDGTERAEVLRDLTWVSLWTRSNAPADARRVEAHSIALLESDDPRSRAVGADLLTALATAMLGAGDYRQAHRACLTLRTRTTDRLTLEQRLLCDVVAVMTGEPDAGALLRRGDDWIASYAWDQVANPANPVGFITVVLGWLGEHDVLDQVIAHCRRSMEVHGPSASGLYITNSMTASREQHRGQWDHALLEFEALERLVIDTDFAGPYPFIALRHAHLLAARGDVEGCERLRWQARDRAPAWVPVMSHLDHAVAGLLALAVRDFPAAQEQLAHAARIEQEAGLVVSGYLSRFADSFEAAWRLGTSESHLAELEEFERAMTAVRHRSMLGLAARCRALVCTSDDMDQEFARAVELLDGETDGFETARTHLLWGERLRRARRKADAHARLALAQEGFTRLGADRWVDQCASELAACGVRRMDSPDVTSGPLAHLTPREFEVAREVGTGLSNAETARRLFISERTVEFHLNNVFRKLAIDRREALSTFVRV